MQNYLNGENLITALLVCLALCWALKMVLDARTGIQKAQQEAREPLMKAEKEVQMLREQTRDMEHRIGHLDRLTDRHDDEMKILLRSQLALLSHQINGNSIDKLKNSMNEITEYLMTK